jgi:(2Fe-2S) ferredoxin
MEHTWTKDFYQETDPAKRQQILKEHIGEEEAWEDGPIRTTQAPEG